MKVQVNKTSGQVTICIPRYLSKALGYIDREGTDQNAEVDPQINTKGNLELVKLESKKVEVKE